MTANTTILEQRAIDPEMTSHSFQMESKVITTLDTRARAASSSSSEHIDEKAGNELPVVQLATTPNPSLPPEPLADDTTPVSEERYITGKPLIFFVVANALAVLLIAMDVSILAPALSRVTDDFHTIADIGWYAVAYLTTNCTFQPLTGKFFLYYPLKLTYFAFLFVFGIGSIIAATAVSSTMLIVGRAVQGIGGAGIMNGSITQVGLLAHPDVYTKIMGIVMACFGLGQIVGPLIGGALTDASTWRWCFWINLFIEALIVLITFLIRFPPSYQRKLSLKTFVRDFDVIGFFLFAPGVVMLLIALQWGGIKYPWDSGHVIGLFCASVVVGIAFVVWEYFAGDHAMIPRSLISRKIVAFSCITASLSNGATVLYTIYLPVWFQVVKGVDSIGSAVHLLPTFLTQTVMAAFSGWAALAIGFFTPLAIGGCAFVAVGTGLFATFNPATPAAHWIGYQVIAGIGRGVTIQQPVQAAQKAVKREEMTTVNGIVMFSQFFGTAIFLGVGQTLFFNLLTHYLGVHVPQINPTTVTSVGSTDFRMVVPQQYWSAVLLSYNDAITKTFLVCMGTSVLAMFTAFGMGWKRVVGKKALKTGEA